jgi:diguanylate cyclase (GGDEF)-like protein
MQAAAEEHADLPKVLIVDDSRMVRASLVKQIRERFEFREEEDGEAAWQALVIDPTIELVLTDIGMPQLDGFGLLERIRASRLPRLQHMPVIIISGDEDAAARERARMLGANDFVMKGTGSTELLARLDSLARLARARRELEDSRAALASRAVVDPTLGLPTGAYLARRGEEALAMARRHHGDISVMVIEIDRFDALALRHGADVPQLVARKLSRILTTKVRREDTVAEIAAGRFAVLSPVSDELGCCAFAFRMQQAIDKLVMTYREARIRITVSIGVSSSSADHVEAIDELVELATGRMLDGQRAGGNRVIGQQGEIDKGALERMFARVVSIDQILGRIRRGENVQELERLPDIVATLLPLLELIESEQACGMPLEALARLAHKDARTH